MNDNEPSREIWEPPTITDLEVPTTGNGSGVGEDGGAAPDCTQS